jgi:hypothetical protein
MIEALARHTGPITMIPPKPKRGRGMGQRTLALRAAIYDIAQECQSRSRGEALATSSSREGSLRQ